MCHSPLRRSDAGVPQPAAPPQRTRWGCPDGPRTRAARTLEQHVLHARGADRGATWAPRRAWAGRRAPLSREADGRPCSATAQSPGAAEAPCRRLPPSAAAKAMQPCRSPRGSSSRAYNRAAEAAEHRAAPHETAVGCRTRSRVMPPLRLSGRGASMHGQSSTFLRAAYDSQRAADTATRRAETTRALFSKFLRTPAAVEWCSLTPHPNRRHSRSSQLAVCGATV